MQDLANRPDITVREALSKPVLMFEDHRNTLGVIYHAHHKGILRTAPTLVMFDKHDDAKPAICGSTRLEEVAEASLHPEDFWQFVRHELSLLDDDWVYIALKFGLIGDVILIGAGHTPNVDEMNGSFSNLAGNTHQIFKVSHVYEGLGYQGWLSDRCYRDRWGPIWHLLGWDPSGGFTSDERPPIILDIDLDCFTIADPDGDPIGWPDRVFHKFFEQMPSNGPLAGKWTQAAFMKDLFTQSEFATIARENTCCGGPVEADELLHRLDTTVFGGELQASI